MAENETITIDGRTASRWRPVRDRISSGESLSDCFADIQDQFYQGLRRACRLMAKRGVPLDCLLTTALERPEDLETLVRQTRNEDYACLLLEVVRNQSFLSLEHLTPAWLSAVLDSVRDSLQLDLNGHSMDTAFNGKIDAMLDRMARLIAQNPSRIPPRPRTAAGRPSDDLGTTLGKSLL